MSSETNISASKPDLVLQLEGLRGVAAFLVFFYHFHHVPALHQITSFAPGFFSTGWVFVDLFFILSGWVMGHVYHDRLLTGQTSARAFFLARIARLYPLLLVSVFAWYAVMPLTGVRVDWGGLQACLPQILTFSYNWGPLACAIPVSPAWSISAEVAVYLTFPVLIWGGLAASLPRAVALMAGGILGYICLAQTTGIHVIDGFAPLRAFFGFACGLSLWRLSQAEKLPIGQTAALLQVVTVVVLGLLFYVQAHPMVIIATLGLLVASLIDGHGPIASLCKSPVLVAAGRLSFGVYIWHWFAIVWMQHYGVSDTPLLMSALVVALVVIWAQLSYVFIEQPGRRALRRVLSKPLEPNLAAIKGTS